MTTNNQSFVTFPFVGMALDPIHVGTGGTRLGRVDNTIVRDPVTRIPKVPGSSIAGVMRAYTAMAKGKYPNCAGLGQPERDGGGGHCGKPIVLCVPCSLCQRHRPAAVSRDRHSAICMCCFPWRRNWGRSGSRVHGIAANQHRGILRTG